MSGRIEADGSLGATARVEPIAGSDEEEDTGEEPNFFQNPKRILLTVGAVIVVGVIAVAFLLGRRKGKKRTTVVEVRRL